MPALRGGSFVVVAAGGVDTWLAEQGGRAKRERRAVGLDRLAVFCFVLYVIWNASK